MGLLHHERAINMTPHGDPTLPVSLQDFSWSLQSRFFRFGWIKDLDEAISYCRCALPLVFGQVYRYPEYLSALGLHLQTRFFEVGDLKDLEEAILCHRKAVRGTPEQHPIIALYLDHLACALRLRFQKLLTIADLEESIALLRRTVDLTGERHTRRSSVYLHDLSYCYLARFQHLGQLNNLSDAISVQHRALQHTVDVQYVLANHLNQSLVNYLERFSRLRDFSDLETSIHQQLRAIQLTSEDRYQSPFLCHHLVICLEERYKLVYKPGDFDSAIAYSRRSCQSSSGDVRSKFSGALRWAYFAHREKRFQVAREGYMTAMALLPQVAWLGLSTEVRQEKLKLTITLDATACAIELGQLELAVELIDQGRSVFWGQGEQLRFDSPATASMDRNLVSELIRVREALQQGLFRDPYAQGGEHLGGDTTTRAYILAERHRRLTEEWELLVTQARKDPAIDELFRPKKFSALSLAAVDGPVVIINTSAFRCDALIVTHNPPHVRHIALNGVNLWDIKNLATELRISAFSPHSSRPLEFDHVSDHDRTWI
jgi:tetratricopeptide (TPR) repeat protein